MMLRSEERQALLEDLEGLPERLADAFRDLTPGEATRPGPDGTFSPVEQCWHLADLEREGFGVRIRRLLAEEGPQLPDFDGARLAAERRYVTRSLVAGLEAFRQARAANLAALRGVSAPDWLRAGTQEGVGPVSLCDIPGMMAEHDAAHRKEIEAWSAASRGDAP